MTNRQIELAIRRLVRDRVPSASRHLLEAGERLQTVNAALYSDNDELDDIIPLLDALARCHSDRRFQLDVYVTGKVHRSDDFVELLDNVSITVTRIGRHCTVEVTQ